MEDFTVMGALLEDRPPGKPGLGTLKADHFEKVVRVAGRHAPFGIVVFDVKWLVLRNPWATLHGGILAACWLRGQMRCLAFSHLTFKVGAAMGRAVRRISGNVLLSFAVAGLLAGCAAVSPESRMGEAGAPGAWAASKEARAGIDRKWVGKIGGRELRALVDEALSNNQNLKAAAARVDRASAEAKIAGAGRLPSLGFGGAANRQRQNFIGFPGGGGGPASSIFEQFGVNLNAAWEADVWGRVKAGQEAAIADAQARQYEYEAARVSIAGQVTKAWLALGEANEQVTLAETAVKAAGVLADAVRERFDRAIADGGGTASQVRLTEAERATRRAALAQRKQERERVLRQLEILLGKYPSGTLAAGAQLPVFPSATPAGLPSELLQRRPDILAAERSLASSGRRVKERKLARFPSLSLTGSGGTNSDSLSDVLRTDTLIWSLGGSLSQPIFEGGRLASGVESATAEEQEQAAMLRKTVLDAFSEVEQALVAETFLAERERAAKQAAALAEEAATRASQEYSAGTGDVLTLIDATTFQIDSASQYAAIRRMRLENRIDLHLALGGDFRASN
jgi:outer membrane protein, multidrug efflux system